MTRFPRPIALAAVLLAIAVSAPALAENDGLDDLDKATQLKVTAETLDDLNEVIDHADTALEKGLDDDNKKFADQLLISSLLQRGQLFAAAVFNVPPQDPQRNLRAMQFRQFALTDLQRAVSLDPKLVEAQLLIGKLQSLPLGDPNAARRALSRVADAEGASPEEKAEALALRSAVQKDEKQRMADLDRAVELQPEKPDYLRLRSQQLYEAEKFDAALADADHALKLEPDHAITNELRGMILLGLEKYDDALASFNRASELMPQAPLPYQHRGELYRKQGDLDKAVEQLSKALELEPESVGTLLVRASVYYELKQVDKALEDVEAAIKLQPALVQPHLMKAEILAASKRLDEAIAHLERLLQLSPGNELLVNRLSTFYLVAGRPRKAIETVSLLVEKDPANFDALRLRADAQLNIGNHAEAVADFDKALALKDDDESVLNNFAWVLATSPDDKLRDGAKALKLATKAAEATGYATPHVLSTLAAAYAETGDFDNAAKWSEKAVELSKKEVDAASEGDDRTKLQADHDQLKKELDSYREHKPVRERQSAEEKAEAPPTTDRAVTPTAQAPARTADF